MAERLGSLRNGVVLAEIGGKGDGPWCAEYGAGAAMAVLGTYIVDTGEDVPYPAAFVFKPGREQYGDYLHENVPAAGLGVDRVAVSVISVELQDTVDFLVEAEAAGADYVSLCLHSGMEMFTRHGLGQALCRRENAALLSEWVTAILAATETPLIVKMGYAGEADTAAAMETLSACGAPSAHVDMRAGGSEADRLAATAGLVGKCEFLIAGGGVADADLARRYLEAGADAVAIATAAMEDPTLCGRVQRELRGE